MKSCVLISLKRLAITRMKQVDSGQLSREQAKGVVRKRYYASTREELIEELTRAYDSDCALALDYFNMI